MRQPPFLPSTTPTPPPPSPPRARPLSETSFQIFQGRRRRHQQQRLRELGTVETGTRPEIWNRLSILLFNHEVNPTRGTEILNKRLATLNPVHASGGRRRGNLYGTQSYRSSNYLRFFYCNTPNGYSMTSAIIDCNNTRFNGLFGDHVLKCDTPGRVEAAFG
jgi:hypothetical protein